MTAVEHVIELAYNEKIANLKNEEDNVVFTEDSLILLTRHIVDIIINRENVNRYVKINETMKAMTIKVYTQYDGFYNVLPLKHQPLFDKLLRSDMFLDRLYAKIESSLGDQSDMFQLGETKSELIIHVENGNFRVNENLLLLTIRIEGYHDIM